MTLKLSDIDHERFGVVTAKATVDDVVELESVFAACAHSGVELLILRVDSSALATVQQAERHGALMMDSLVYFEKKLAQEEGDDTCPPSITLREAVSADGPRVAQLATSIFSDYQSHYHADPKLSKVQADQVYASWAENACLSPQVADVVLLVERADAVIGFAALKVRGPLSFDCCLVGVSPSARREGLFGLLLHAAENWGQRRGLRVMEYSTQITNVAAQRGLCKQGFLPVRSCYTLHRWFV